jgi:glycosyltransferase involved in cell wall biosynthesis
MGISIIIPTYNGGHIFSKCLEMIGQQAYEGPVQLVVVDSGSTDGTVGLAEKAGALIRRIDKGAFHHARTRNEAISLAAFDRVIFMVQDAVPCSDSWLSGMAHGLEGDGMAAAFAAHVPHADATPYARFETESIARARLEASAVEGIQSLDSFQEMPYEKAYRRVGIDNVCAIYRKELLEKTLFPDVDFAEDLAWALKISLLGHRISYLPHIQVRHSHNRSPDYGFRRQVVNSYWVARIMGRVMEDLSYLSLCDLMSVTWAVRCFLFQRTREQRHRLRGAEGQGLFVDRLLKRYRLIYRIRALSVYSFLSRYPGWPSSRAKGSAQQATADIAYQLKLIENGYPPRDGNEWFQTLEQVATNILGRIYGEVYAGRMLKGRVSRQLEDFMRPFLSGV